MIFRGFIAIILLACAAVGTQAQTGELNLLTDLGTPFPPGCLSIDLPEQPRSQDSLLVDTDVSAPTVNSSSLDGSFELQIWRVACDDEDFSVVLVRMRQNGGANPIVVPQVFADAGDVDLPFHEAQLLLLPGAGNVGATGGIISDQGTTWMLAVDPFSIDGTTTFLPDDYNATFTVEFNWGSFATASTEGRRFVLDQFEPTLDLPQFDAPVLNGRYSGQWVREGAERQGLVLQIAERVDQNFVSQNFVRHILYLSQRRADLGGRQHHARPGRAGSGQHSHVDAGKRRLHYRFQSAATRSGFIQRGRQHRNRSTRLQPVARELRLRTARQGQRLDRAGSSSSDSGLRLQSLAIALRCTPPMDHECPLLGNTQTPAMAPESFRSNAMTSACR